MMRISIRPIAGGAMLAALSLLLAACLLMPGAFVSELDIRKNGTFRFDYAGEITFLPLARQAEGDTAEEKAFEPEPCHNDDYEERRCTRDELSGQKSEWEQQQAAEKARRKQEAEAAAAFLGGINPDDPKSAEELAARLRRQAGWRQVDYKGNGVFDVDFSITGSLDHDFTFPTMEGFPMANAFVQLSRRQDGTVRINAPGFSPASSASPLGGMLQMADMEGATGANPAATLDGAFTITTDAEILANNTEEGPAPDAEGQRLHWTINPHSTAAPMALLRLSE